MRSFQRPSTLLAAFILSLLASTLAFSQAIDKTWDGGGANNNWTTAANWDAAVVAGDSLIFAGSTRLAPTNDFPAGTPFAGLTFNSGAGAFTLSGNSIALTGNITDNQATTVMTIGVALAPTATPSVNVVSNGILSISGAISGTFGLTKTGPGRLTLRGANTFTGAVTVTAGTLRVNANSALGATTGSTTLGIGTTLDVSGPNAGTNRLDLGTEQIYVIGSGVNGEGAIWSNFSNSQSNALQLVALTGHTTFGGTGPWTATGANPGRWDIRGTPATAVLSTGGQPYNLLKVGANEVRLAGITIDPALANIDIQGGTLVFEGNISSLGNPASTLTVHPGATLGLFNSTTQMNKQFVLLGNGVTDTVYDRSGTVTLTGPITLTNDCIFRVIGGSGLLNCLGAISGSGSLTKVGGAATPTATLALAATNTYTGNTLVSAGTLALTGSGSISNSASLTVASGAILNVNGRTDQTLTLATGQTLRGDGSFVGNVAVSPVATIAPGTNAIGTLTVNGNLTLVGLALMEINRTNTPASDLVSGIATVTYGGTLTVVNLGPALQAGDCFTLFTATDYTGSFAVVNLPSLGPCLAWDTSTLAQNGRICVVVATPDTTPPILVSASAVCAGNKVFVTFREPLKASTAAEAFNYQISGGVVIQSAMLAVDGQTVCLFTDPLTADVGYTLTVDGVQDLCGNAIAPNSQTLFYCSPLPPIGVFINEWLAGNTNDIVDLTDGQHDDWFELYNPGPNAATLAGHFLTDTLTNKFKFPIPAGYVVPAGGYLLVWADNQTQENTNTSPDLHVNFMLASGGGEIGLFAADGTALDAISFAAQTNDVSEGRFPDGGSSRFFMTRTTPRAPNVLAPQITVQPQSQTVAAGSNATFSVVAAGTAPLSYQWLHGSTPVAGATGPTLALEDVQLGDAGTYSVIVSNSFGGVLSASAVLTVGQGNNRYEFDADDALGTITNTEPEGASGGVDILDFSATTTQPIFIDLSRTTPQTINSNLTLSLASSNAIENVIGGSGDDTLIGNTLNNILEGGRGNDHLAGAQGDDVYVFNTDGPLGADLIVEAAGPGGGVDTLNFSPTTQQSVFINLGSTDPQLVNSNLTLTLSASDAVENAIGGTLDDVLIGNVLNNVLSGLAGDDTYAFANNWGQDILVEAVDGGNDTLDFSAVTSALTVNVAGDITVTSGTNSVINVGGTIESIRGGSAGDTFTVSGSPNTELHIDGRGGVNQLNFDAGGAFVFITPDSIMADGRQAVYYSGFSQVNLLNTTSGVPPAITIPPLSKTVGASAAVTFAVTATGTAPLQYQWRLNGEAISGATNSSLTLTNVQFDAQGDYDVQVSNASGSTASAVATLTVSAVQPPGLVLINEVLTHPNESQVNFIELSGTGVVAVDISGWFLTDNFGVPQKFRIPNGTIVPAGGYLVVDENALGFTLNRNGGEVYLSAADNAGNLSGYSHGFQFGPAEGGVSFGRHVASLGAEHFVAQTSVTRGAANAGPKVGPVVVSEIQFQPPANAGSNNVMDEFIELRNVSANPVALFDPSFPSNAWHLRTAVEFDFPANTVLPPGGYLLVVSFDPAANAPALASFRAKYGVPPGVVIVGPYTGELDDFGASLELFKPGTPVSAPEPNVGFVPYILADKVEYTSAPPWPGGADGTGASLQRRVNAEYGDDPINWAVALATAGAAYPGPTAPSILVQPQALTVMTDGGAVFTVTVAGTPPFNYQWRRNGANITVANGNSYEIFVAQATDAGSYDVLVSNAAGSVTSASAVLAVSPPTAILAYGLTHNALGGASLLQQGTDLIVSAIGAGGVAGVNIQLNEADGVSVSLQPVGLALSGQALSLGAVGSLGGVPGSSLGTVVISNVNQTLQISANYLSIGASNVRVEIYQGTRLVDTVLEPPSGVVGTLAPGSAGLPQIVRAQALPSNPGGTPGFEIHLDRLGLFTPSGGQPSLGDHIRILALNASNTVGHLSAVNITGANLNSIQIIGETVGPPAPVLGFYRDGDAMVLTWVGDAYHLLTAPEVAGIRIELSGAISPYAYPIPPEEGKRFFWLSWYGPDSDGDGLPDDWEVQHGLNPFDLSDAAQDPDGDGLSDLSEYHRQTDPRNSASGLAMLYADGVFGNDWNDGLAPYLGNGHGPKKLIQSAIFSATPNDGLSIAPGSYRESLIFTNTLGPVIAPKAVVGPAP